MMTDEIRARLFALRDEGYAAFQARLMPNVDPARIIGVRTPALRALAKEYARHAEIDAFLAGLPHRYYDENNLHGFLIAEGKDYDRTIGLLDAFLPHVDNWATCDLLSPKVFKKNRARLAAEIERWLASDEAFTVRFGVEMVMSHFLAEDFDAAWLERVSVVKSGEYYLNMLLAWCFAEALVRRWDDALPYLTGRRLDAWVHNRTIQKAVESCRLTDDQKDLLRRLKIH